MEKLVPDVRKRPTNSRWFTMPTSTIEMQFSESTPRPLQICLSETVRQIETPPSIKTDPILNNCLTQTMENNAHSGVIIRHVQATYRLRKPIE